MGGKVAEAFLDGVKTGFGAEQGKPWGPDVGRHEKAVRHFFKLDLQQVAGIETEDGAAVGLDVADGGEPAVDPLRAREIRGKEDVVDLAHPIMPLVDGADFRGEEKADRDRLGGDAGQGRGGFLVTKPEQAGFRRDKLLLDLGEPAGMGKVAGADQVDALDPRPGSESGQGAFPAGGPGKGGMDMEVGEKVHGV